MKVRWKVLSDCTQYAVSSDGRVKRLGGVVLKPVMIRGYLAVSISGKIRKIHRLVLETFVGPCPVGFQACHNDGDYSNNSLSNLRWDTAKSNAGDRIRHCTQVRGEVCHSAKFTEAPAV